ncbi:hypothetical protein EDB89DRAFT_2074295 [Lactarius sanguifluus]|nr:hypothetical protein EDB89DRAFT_2074295 [Lactarius sanguifluus]
MSTCRPARSFRLSSDPRTRARRCTSNFLTDRPTRRTDDHYIIALTDANFGHYRITEADPGRVMNASSESQDGICEDLETACGQVKRHFPSRASLVAHSADIPKVLFEHHGRLVGL